MRNDSYAKFERFPKNIINSIIDWDMGQIAPGQSDCRLLNQLYLIENAWPYKLRIAKSYFDNSWLGMVKNGNGLYGYGTLKSVVAQIWLDIVENGCGHSGHITVKLAVSQEGINGIKWVFACCYKFRMAES